jgi:hypothetical protein
MAKENTTVMNHEGETESDAWESFKINIYLVIINSLLSEMDEQRLAYEN